MQQKVPPGLVLWKEQSQGWAPGEKYLLTFQTSLVEWKLTSSKMEISPSPQEPALEFTLFIQQMEGALVSLSPQLRASLQIVPWTRAWVASEQGYLEKEKKKSKVGK